MKKILITGGAVEATLDDVKIIVAPSGSLTIGNNQNPIKADKKVHVTYLCSKNSQQPWWDEFLGSEDTPHCDVIHHDGIDDYMKKVLELTLNMDAVVLGAAVANLVPKEKIEGKFPSHNYKVGDTIPIDFTIAPRVIDEVKKVNPKVHLFGYKLLSGVDYYELVRAAYGVLLESKAVTVFANDAKDLMQKYAITKERGVHPIHNNDVMQWILDRINEDYYITITTENNQVLENMKDAKYRLKDIINVNKNSFIEVEEGYVFGSAAMRILENKNVFVTTVRGKREIADFTFVTEVDHLKRKVYCATNKKASLNAPLFERIFTHLSEVMYILHFHHQREDLITLEYATPGTDKDSIRDILKYHSFNIKGHGCILSYDKNGELLK